LVHSLSVTGEDESKQLYCLVSHGSKIEKLPNGLYAIDDKSYYVEFERKTSPILRTTSDGSQELILPVQLKDNMGKVTYSIVW